VTRVVAGTAGGRALRVPDRGTRPTSERVREALFSRLEHLGVVAGACVLDLYAGSGALGLEAASRGAAAVTLVDSSRAAADVCRANAAALGLADRVTVVADRAERFVARPPAAPWRLVLLDPPYDAAEPALAAVLAAQAGRAGGSALDGGERALVRPALDEAAVVVVERSTRSPEPTWPAGLARFDERRYGETTLWLAEPTD
jgi:16S rRNA (guanine966-N2)-methyltransferase